MLRVVWQGLELYTKIYNSMGRVNYAPSIPSNLIISSFLTYHFFFHFLIFFLIFLVLLLFYTFLPFLYLVLLSFFLFLMPFLFSPFSFLFDYLQYFNFQYTSPFSVLLSSFPLMFIHIFSYVFWLRLWVLLYPPFFNTYYNVLCWFSQKCVMIRSPQPLPKKKLCT